MLCWLTSKMSSSTNGFLKLFMCCFSCLHVFSLDFGVWRFWGLGIFLCCENNSTKIKRKTQREVLFFFGKDTEVQREIFVDLPDAQQHVENCSLLVKSMYGTHDASALWQDDCKCSRMQCTWKERRVQHCSTTSQRTVEFLVREDDICAMGAHDAMGVVDEVLRRRYELRECRYRGSGQETNQSSHHQRNAAG